MATARQDTLKIRDKDNHSDRWMDLPRKSWPTLHESIAKGLFEVKEPQAASGYMPAISTTYIPAYRQAGLLKRFGVRKLVRAAGIGEREVESTIGKIFHLKNLICNQSMGNETSEALAAFDYGVLHPGGKRYRGYFGYQPRVINGPKRLEQRLDVAEAILYKTGGSAIKEALEVIPAFAASNDSKGWLTLENGLRLSWIVETTKSPGQGFAGRFEFPELVSTSLGYLALNEKSDPKRDLPVFMAIVDAVTAVPLMGPWGAFMPLRTLVVNENFNPETDLPAFLHAFERLNSATSTEETGPVFECLRNAVSNASFEPQKSFPLFASAVEGICKNTSGEERVKAMDAFFSFIETARAMGIHPLQCAADITCNQAGPMLVMAITTLDLLLQAVPYSEVMRQLVTVGPDAANKPVHGPAAVPV
jgi:hypothetical protein